MATIRDKAAQGGDSETVGHVRTVARFSRSPSGSEASPTR